MPQHIAFLRGINLGRRRVKMETLRAHFAKLGFTSVETFIASGNVLFSTRSSDSPKLAAKIAAHLEKSLGYDVATFVRTRAEVAVIAAFRPFPDGDMNPPENTVHCGFLAESLSVAQARALEACRTEYDAFRVHGREYYWLCRQIKTHESTIWSSHEVKALKLPSSSMRNLTTIRKLAELFPAA